MMQVVSGRCSVDVHPTRPSIITNDTMDTTRTNSENRKCGCGLLSAMMRRMPACLKLKRNKKSSSPLVMASPSGCEFVS